MDISLYQLTATSIEKTLPKLLEKVYEAGFRIHILCDTPEHVSLYNASLWTYSPSSFLPHGMEGDPQDHPIWISTEACNKNKAAVLVITNGEEAIDLHQYKRCLDMFDGNDEESVKKAQGRVKNYLSQGHSLTYWKQTIKGTWEKKELVEMC